jgi:hypothetical protein
MSHIAAADARACGQSALSARSSTLSIPLDRTPAIKVFQLRLPTGKARGEVHAESTQDGEVRLVDAVYVAGDRRPHDVWVSL